MTSSLSSSDSHAKAAYKPSPYVESFTVMTTFISIADLSTETPLIPSFKSKLEPRDSFSVCTRSYYVTLPGSRAALNGDFQESKNQAIEMAEDDPTVFRYFQYWAYTGRLIDQDEILWHTLFGIYIFAEVRCIPALQNIAIDVVISKHESSLRAPVVEYRYVYENTAEKSPVRKFFAEWAASRGILKDWFNDRTIIPTDFAIDLSLALYDRIKKGTTYSDAHFLRMRSKYHTEGATSPSSDGKSGPS